MLQVWLSTPPPTHTHRVTTSCLLFSGVISLMSNIVVLLMFVKFKELRTATNLIIINLAFTDIGVAGIGYPMSAASDIHGSWKFGYTGCQVGGMWSAFISIISLIEQHTSTRVHKNTEVLFKNHHLDAQFSILPTVFKDPSCVVSSCICTAQCLGNRGVTIHTRHDWVYKSLRAGLVLVNFGSA